MEMESAPLRILLVEGNPADARLLRETLDDAGSLAFELMQVERLDAAEEVLSREELDIVLLNLSLPDSQGLATLRRADAAAPRVPIIVLTGADDEHLALDAVKAGAQDYLIKGEVGGPLLVRAIHYALERNRLLEQVELEHERLKAVIRHMPLGVLIAEAPSGEIVMGNPQVEQIVHNPLPAFRGLDTLHDLTGYRASGRRMQPDEWVLTRALRGVTVRGDEFLFERGDGTRTWIRASGAPIRSAGGDITGAVITFEDIDEEKRAEEAERFLAEAGTLLGSSLDYEETLESVARLAVRSLADYCVVDIAGAEGSLRRLQVAAGAAANEEAACELLRHPLDREHPHLSLEVLRTRQPTLVPEITDELLRSLAQDEEQLRSLRALEAISYMAVPLLAREHFLGTLVFISSQRRYGPEDLRLAEELARRASLAVDDARLYREAQEALRARDDVLRVVSHDLRNPLSTIHMSTELLLDSQVPLDEEQRRRQVHMIRRSAERMNRLIQDLLDVARIEAGRMYLERDYLQPANLVREAVELNAALAAAKALTLRPEGGDATSPVLADRDRVLQVLANLIGNAIKFTPSGGEITVRAEPVNGEICFSVADSGPGIREDDLTRLFRPFWQGRRGGREGAGLGLTIAKGIVEAHGGRIWATSEPGAGATLCFTLPAAEERRSGTDSTAVPGEA